MIADVLIALAAFDPFTAAITAIFGAGGIGAVAAWRRAGPEVQQIGVNTLKTVIEELDKELKRRGDLIEEQRLELDGCHSEIAELRRRVVALEAKVADSGPSAL